MAIFFNAMRGRPPVRVERHLRFALSSQRDMRINVAPPGAA